MTYFSSTPVIPDRTDRNIDTAIIIPVFAPYLTLSYQGNELDGIAAVKIGLFKLYKNVSILLCRIQ